MNTIGPLSTIYTSSRPSLGILGRLESSNTKPTHKKISEKHKIVKIKNLI
jgi:hypothetical protein